MAWRQCPEGYCKEYDDSLTFSKASCVHGEQCRSEDAQCKAKGGRWVGLKGHHARGVCIPCRGLDCAEAVANPLFHAYKIYFASIGSGATMRNLPPKVQETLKPYFHPALLSVIQYGGSHYTFDSNAMTDCAKIYFAAGSGDVMAIHQGTILTNRSQFHLLIHEISHSSQCNGMSQVRYAEQWFGQLGATTVEQVMTHPTKVSAKMIHNRMPMER